MKRFSLLFLATLLICLLIPKQSSAHVFFTNETGTSGVIMHLTPDDDPVAGELASMYFDIKDTKLSTETHNYRLYIIDASNMQTQASTNPIGSQSVSALYVFPVQGTYTLELRATPIYDANRLEQKPVIFRYSQSVNRGITASALDEPRYAWAEVGFIFAFVILGVVIVAVFNRRKDMIRYTK